jgi:protein TonB
MGIHMKPEIAMRYEAPSASAEGAFARGEGYQPRRNSLTAIALTLLVQATPFAIALWVWQPALVQIAPAASLTVFDVPAPQTPTETAPPEPVETPPDEAMATPAPSVQAVPVDPAIVISTQGPSSPTLPVISPPTPAAKVQPAPPPRTAPSAPSENPADWQSRVLGRLNAAKAYPASARARRQQGVVLIRFTLSRRGDVLGIALAESSGFALLDREALALPKRASPLPPPPDDVKGERIELVVPVEFHF